MASYYEKDFDTWNTLKHSIEKIDESVLYFKERDIWWCSIGSNIGQEESGKGHRFMRPALIIKKLTPRICWIVPLSTQIHDGNYFFPLLSTSNVIRFASLHQLRLVSSKRLVKKIDLISQEEMIFVKEKIIALLQ